MGRFIVGVHTCYFCLHELCSKHMKECLYIFHFTENTCSKISVRGTYTHGKSRKLPEFDTWSTVLKLE